MTKADIIIQNAAVYTVDDENPTADAVAIADNRICYVGDNVGIEMLIGDKTRVIDGAGRTLLPGIIDTHFHLQWGSHSLYGAQLHDVNTLSELSDALRSWADENPDAPFVVGQGVSYGIPDNTTPLTRHHLDAIIEDRPILLTAFDLHSCFANTKALESAEILYGIDDPLPNGDIVLDANGMATGELYEMDAMAAARSALPKPDFDQEVAILKEGLRLAASYGITSVHNMDGDAEQASLYGWLEEHDQLTLRIYAPFWVKPETELATMQEQATILRTRYNSDLLHGGAVKFFMDGVYESHTAVSVNGFADRPGDYGEPIWSAERFGEFVTVADSMGLQIAVHAVGDGAVRHVLNGYEAAQQANGKRDSRHRIEHIELIQIEDIARFMELGVIASMQPLHAPMGGYDSDPWLSRVHPDEYDRAFPWRTLRDAGATLVFGSDWPVVTSDPYLGMWGTLCRKTGQPGEKSHAQTLAETIRSYTRDAASSLVEPRSLCH